MSPERSRWVVAAVVCPVVFLSPSASRADNPIIQTNYTADPAPVVFDDTLYVYTTHDEDVTVNDFFTMNDWRVYSTKDVVNWTDHGAVLHYRDFSWAGGNAWAGQATFRDGRYFFYVPVVRTNGANAIGVAVSDSPTGPFEDAIGAPLITSDCGDIDPTVFIDDDEQAYLYWGNPNLCYVLLNDDMISYRGDVVEVPRTTQALGPRTDTERPVAYEEGPWFYKRQDLYYLVFPGGPLPEHIAYSTSPGPTGPFTYRGVIMPAEGSSFTNHPGVIDYKGKSLFFYHNGALPGGGGFKRSVCVEEFEYGPDGSIPELRMTAEGAAAVDVLNPFVRTEAETMAWASGVETEPSSAGGMNVTDIDDGDGIKVEAVEFGSGASSFEASVAAASAGGAIELRLDDENGTLLGTCPVEGTGGDSTWATLTCPIDGATGRQDLFLRFTGGGFKVDWWRFSGPGEPGPVGSGGQGGAAGSGGIGPLGGEGGTVGQGGFAGGPEAAGMGGSSTTGGAPASGGTPSAGAPSGVGNAASEPSGGSSPVPGPAGPAVPTAPGPPSEPGTPGTAVPGPTAGGGNVPAAEDTTDDGGCGCVVGSRSSLPRAGAFAVILAGLGWRRTRRRSRGSSAR